MNENLYMAHKKFRTKRCMFIAPSAHKCSCKGENITKIHATGALCENQNERINVCDDHTYKHGQNQMNTYFQEYTQIHSSMYPKSNKSAKYQTTGNKIAHNVKTQLG